MPASSSMTNIRLRLPPPWLRTKDVWPDIYFTQHYSFSYGLYPGSRDPFNPSSKEEGWFSPPTRPKPQTTFPEYRLFTYTAANSPFSFPGLGSIFMINTAFRQANSKLDKRRKVSWQSRELINMNELEGHGQFLLRVAAIGSLSPMVNWQNAWGFIPEFAHFFSGLYSVTV